MCRSGDNPPEGIFDSRLWDFRLAPLRDALSLLFAVENFGEGFLEALGGDGLDEMFHEAGVAGHLEVGFHAVAGHGDGLDVAVVADLAEEFDTGTVGEA